MSTSAQSSGSISTSGSVGRRDYEYHIALWRTGNAQKVSCDFDFDVTAFRIARSPCGRAPGPVRFTSQTHQCQASSGKRRRPGLGQWPLRTTVSIGSNEIDDIAADIAAEG